MALSSRRRVTARKIRDEAVDVAVEAIPGDGLLADGQCRGSDGLWEGTSTPSWREWRRWAVLVIQSAVSSSCQVAVVEDEDARRGGGRGLAGA